MEYYLANGFYVYKLPNYELIASFPPKGNKEEEFIIFTYKDDEE